MKKNPHLKVKPGIPFRWLAATLAAVLLLFGRASAQQEEPRISLSMEKATVESVLEQLRSRYGYSFIYQPQDLDIRKPVSIHVTDKSIGEVLDIVLAQQPVTYEVRAKIIHISPKKKAEAAGAPKSGSVEGKVTDETGEPVVGAAVVIKGTTRGVSTGSEGNFRLDAPKGAVLHITALGYVSTDIPVNGRSYIAVKMLQDTKIMEEVVVVGYGVQKKANLTGAVSTINVSKEIASRPLTNLSTALAGMSAGLQVMQSSGQPNGDVASFRIRGTGTLNASSPLILIDGMEQTFTDINPNDIASVSVLKDAASCAIYGNRGANGVILITTKTGTKGKINVNYSGIFSFNQPSNLIELVSNSANYMELMNESSNNVGQGDIFSAETIALWRNAEKDPNGISPKGYPNRVAYPNTDWYKAIFKNKMMMEHTVSVVGATERTNFNFSGTYLDNPGLITGSGLKKYYIRSNISVNIADWLTVGNRTYGYQNDVERNSTSGTLTGLGFKKMVPSIYPYYDGMYGAPEPKEEDPQSHNPLWDIESTGGSYTYSQVNTSMFADVRFLKDFVYHANFDWTRYWREDLYHTKSVGKYSFSQGQMAIAPKPSEELSSMFYTLGNKRWRFEQTLTWNKTLNDVHEIGALVGYEEMKASTYTVDAQKTGLIDETITDLSTATEMKGIYGGNSEYSSRSVFGRVTYAYDSRYLLEMNLRWDGSSRFAPQSRWGWFPSFSAGWRISQEQFMENVPLDNLKLRASWGKLGNNSIGNYEWQSTYDAANYPLGNSLHSGLAMTSLANSFLQWESTAITNIGLEIGALRNRLVFEADIYHKLTDGILYRPAIYAAMGNKTAPYENIAEVVNRGVELSAGWNDRKGDLSYGVKANFAYNHNRVSKYKGELQRGWTTDSEGNRVYQTNIGDVSTGTTNRVIEGKMINEFYTLETYKGDQSYFHSDGSVNVNGGPKDGMIRTPKDMQWLSAMKDAGYSFYPNQSIGAANIWYGDYIYADLNGDGVYGNGHDYDFQNLSTQPKYNYGLQAYVSWKGIDLSMNWAGAAGFGIYWYEVGQNSSATIFGYAIPKAIADDHYFYDPANPNDPRTNLTSKNPRLSRNSGASQNGEISTLHLERGDYLKLKNLTVGYTFPSGILRKLRMQSLRVFLSCENLWTITGFSGMDPEMQTGVGYVTMRQFALGVNVTF